MDAIDKIGRVCNERVNERVHERVCDKRVYERVCDGCVIRG